MYTFLLTNLRLFTELCSNADSELFHRVINNNKHVLHGLVSPMSVICFSEL